MGKKGGKKETAKDVEPAEETTTATKKRQSRTSQKALELVG